MWKIVYRKSVRKDLKRISPDVRDILRRAIEERLMIDPVRFGIPLRRTLKRLMKLRVGDYRIIYSILKKTVVVSII
jgi:mRNA-degrading endonuclease RelE of RelBE toxin-antitoxin system